MPYKNKADANAAARRRWAENPEVRRKGKEATANWEKENKEQNDAYRAKWMKDHRFKNYVDARAYEFMREMKKYGTTVEWYRARLIEQSGICAICNHLSHHHGTLQRLQVDHNHECCDLRTKSCGKCLRGLLCADCNINLSYLEKFLADAWVFPMLGKGNSWTGRALKYLDSYKGIALN